MQQPTGSQPTTRAFRRALILAVLVALVAWSAGSQEPTSAPFTDRAEVSAELRTGELPSFVPGLVLWLDGADADTLFADPAGTLPAGASDPLARWEDKSGRGNDAQQTTLAARPTLAVRDGRPVPVFDGADQLLLGPSLLPRGTTDSTIFVVAQLDVASGLQGALAHGGTTAGSLRWVGATEGDAYLSANGAANPTSSAWPVGAPGLVTAGFQSGTSATIRQRGGDDATVVGAHSTGSTSATVGSGNGTQYWRGSVHEILVYERALSDQERRAVELHLADKWNLDLAPAAPTGLDAQVMIDGGLAVSWTPPADDGGSALTDYTVQYRQQGSSSWLTLADGTSTATTATITGLTSGTTYEVRVAAHNGIGRGSWSSSANATALSPWTPADLQGGTALWLDADAPGTLTLSGGSVAEWRDRSGNGRVVTQATAGARPTVDAATGMVAFDGVNDVLTGTMVPISGEVSVFGAARFDLATQPGGDYDYVYDLGVGSGSAGRNISLSRSASDNRSYLWDGAAPLWGPTLAGQRPLVFAQAISYASPRYRLWLDGTLGATTAWTGTLDLDGSVHLGWWPGNGTHFLDGAVGELVVVEGTLSDADRERIEGYLAHQWGAADHLPTGHPYKVAPPMTATPATAPSAPSGLVAVPGDGAVQLSWIAPSTDGGTAIKDYVVEVVGNAAFTGATVVADGTSSATSATVTGLGNGTAAWFRVRAVNAAGTSTWAPTTASVTPASYRDAVLADGPTGWWRLGEPSGTVAYSEQNGRHGAYTGTFTLQAADPLTADADRAVAFGNTGWVAVPSAQAPSLGSSSFTLETWVAPGAQGGPIIDRFLYTALGSTGHQGFTWKLNACDTNAHSRGRCPFLRIWDRNGTNDVRLSTTPLPQGTWTHLAVTVDRTTNTARLYVDGSPVGNAISLNLTGSIDVDLPLRIGYKDVGPIERFDGSLDEVAVYPTVLSPERIAAHHRAGITGTNDGVTPAVPTGLTATPGDAQVALSWDAVADADVGGYRVFRDGTLVAQQTGTTFIDTGLTNGTTYAYTVEAYDTRGNRSPVSAAATATPDGPPGAVGSLSATAGGGAVVLTWAAPTSNGSPVTDYIVEQRPSGGSWVTVADGISPSTGALLTGLTAGTPLELRVTAVNANGSGTAATTTATPLAMWSPADIAGGVAAWFDASDPTTLTLDGSSVTAWRDRSGNGRHVTASGANRPTISTLAPGGPGTLDFDGGDWLGSSLPLDLTTGATVYVTAHNDARKNYNGLVRVAPTVDAQASRFELYWQGSTSGSGNLVTAANRGGAFRFEAANDAGPAPGTWYLVGTVIDPASPTNAAQYVQGSAAPDSQTWPTGTLVPAGPSTLWIGSGYGDPNGKLDGGLGEIVIAAAPLGTTDRQRLEGYLAHRWDTAAALPSDHPFRFMPPGIATPATPPASPTALTAVPGDGDVLLSWTAPASDGGSVLRDYVIEHATDAAFTSPVVVADGVSTSTTATVSGLANGTPRWFRVRAVSAAGGGAWLTTDSSVTPADYRAAVLADAPAGWWRLGEPSGTLAYSETGTGLTATAVGSPTTITADALTASVDRARSFAGSYYGIPNVAATQSAEGTLEAWVRATAPGSNFRGIFVKPFAYGLFLTNGTLGTYDWDTNSHRSTGRDLRDGQWHHVAMTYRSGVTDGTIIYLDGEPVLTTTLTVANHSTGFRIGDNIGQTLTGDIDEAAFYPTVLSPERIAAHHRAGVTGTNDGVAPATPADLIATGADQQVDLAWTAPADSDVAGYRLFRDGTLVAQQTGTTLIDTGRTNGTTHAYTVEAYDTRGNRSPVTASTSGTARIAPGAPTGLTATPNGDRSIGLSWTAPLVVGEPPLTDYRIDYRPQGGSWTVFPDTVSTATTATVTDLTVGTTYEFRVTPVHTIGDGATSAVASAQALAAWTPADLPGGLVVWLDAADAATLSTTAGVVETWRDRSGNALDVGQATASRRPTPIAGALNGRTVLRFDGGDALTTLAFPTTGWTGLTVFTVARWTTTGTSTSTIQALLDNNHDATNGFVIQDRPDLPNRPITFHPTADTVTTGDGTWRLIGGTKSWGATAVGRIHVDGARRATTANSSANTFRNQFHVGAWSGTSRYLNGDIAEVMVVNGVLDDATILQLEGYLAHRWGLQAGLAADHPYKTAPPLTATPATPPAAPTGLTATGSTGQIALSWTAPAVTGTPIRDYVVQHRSVGGPWTTLADGVSTSTTATVTGLTDGTTYEVRVAAVSAAGTGAWATETAMSAQPWTPANLPSLALWLDAADESTFTSDATGISQWRDRSGLGNHASQAASANRPERNASGWVEFRGTDFMDGAMPAGTLPTSLQATVVFRKTGTANTYEAYPFNRGAANVARPLDYYNTALFVGDATSHASVGGVNLKDQTNWTTLSTLVSGALIQQHQNGTLARDFPGTRPYGDPLGVYYLATRADKATRLTGDVREIVVTPLLSDEDRQKLEGYLAHKWGTTADLPDGHPYKTSAPTV